MNCIVINLYLHIKVPIKQKNCDVLSVVNVYFDYLKLCVVHIYSRRHLCCGECNVVSNGYDGCVCLRGLCSHVVALGLSMRLYLLPI